LSVVGCGVRRLSTTTWTPIPSDIPTVHDAGR